MQFLIEISVKIFSMGTQTIFFSVLNVSVHFLWALYACPGPQILLREQACKSLVLLCVNCTGLLVFAWLLECFWKVKAERRKWCHYRGKGRSHFSYHCVSDCLLSPSSAQPRLWIGSSEVFPAGQLQHCCWRASATSEEHRPDWKQHFTDDWSQLMGEKMTPWWTGLAPRKRIHHFGKEINEGHSASLLASGQQLALQPPD